MSNRNTENDPIPYGDWCLEANEERGTLKQIQVDNTTCPICKAMLPKDNAWQLAHASKCRGHSRESTLATIQAQIDVLDAEIDAKKRKRQDLLKEYLAVSERTSDLTNYIKDVI